MYEKKKVLVICRSAVGQMYLGVLLNRIGYMPVFARTAGESLQLAKDNVFVLALLDGDLPERDRSVAISFLKMNPLIKLLPLVVILTIENRTVYEALLYEGCAAVISKPVDVSLMYGIIGRLSGEPRQAPRIPVRMSVEIEEQDPEAFLTSVNLSESGIFLRTHKPLPENTVLHLTFTLPYDSEKITATGEVARKAPLGVQFDTEPGIGIRFTEISEDAIDRIRNYVTWSLTGDLEWEAGPRSN